MSFARKSPRPVRSAGVGAAGSASGVSVALLRDIQALQGTGDEILDALVPSVRLLQLGAGQRLLKQGEPNLRVYVVISGRLRVELDGASRPLAYINRGETVGELSLLAASTATASVAAE